MAEWRTRMPDCSGWWWLDRTGPMVVEVVAEEVRGFGAGEVRLPGERRWRDLKDFARCKWAGPIDLPAGVPVLLQAPRTKRRRATTKTSRGLSGTRRRTCKERGGYRCAVCGWTPPAGFPRLVEAHHIVPVSAGGDNRPTNLILLCPNHHRIAHVLSCGCARVGAVDQLVTEIRRLDAPSTRPDSQPAEGSVTGFNSCAGKELQPKSGQPVTENPFEEPAEKRDPTPTFAASSRGGPSTTSSAEIARKSISGLALKPVTEGFPARESEGPS